MALPPPTGGVAASPYAAVDDKNSHLDEKDTYVTTTPASSVSASETDLVNKYYEPPDSYESKHRWDPKAVWTPQEEKRLVRKLNWKVAAAACLCFGALNLDRSNISNALSDNMLPDLHMSTADYNVGQTLFYACFLAAELPSQMRESALRRAACMY